MSMSLRLPDFIIGGAPRSGTTWLREALRGHPRIRFAEPVQPEPKFFLVDEIYQTGLPSYSSRWFRDIPPDLRAGEKSTNYLESAAAARRMAEDVPSLKLIFLLREPVDRAWSNYRWSRRNGLESESFERALELEEEREASVPAELRYSRPHAYFSRGLYARLLRPFLERFPKEQLLLLRY